MASIKSAMQIRKDAERVGLDPNNYTGYQEAVAREQQAGDVAAKQFMEQFKTRFSNKELK